MLSEIWSFSVGYKDITVWDDYMCCFTSLKPLRTFSFFFFFYKKKIKIFFEGVYVWSLLNLTKELSLSLQFWGFFLHPAKSGNSWNILAQLSCRNSSPPRQCLFHYTKLRIRLQGKSVTIGPSEKRSDGETLAILSLILCTCWIPTLKAPPVTFLKLQDSSRTSSK